MRPPVGPLVIAFALALPARTVAAQDRATGIITATAHIVEQPIALRPVDDVRFGALLPGMPAMVDPQRSARAGKVEIHVAERTEFTVDFALPSRLRSATGADEIPLAFGAGSACRASRDVQTNCDPIDPGVALPARICSPSADTSVLYVWLGGTALPDAAQAPGSYRATVVATIQYTGN